MKKYCIRKKNVLYYKRYITKYKQTKEEVLSLYRYHTLVPKKVQSFVLKKANLTSLNNEVDLRMFINTLLEIMNIQGIVTNAPIEFNELTGKLEFSVIEIKLLDNTSIKNIKGYVHALQKRKNISLPIDKNKEMEWAS